MKVVVRVLVIPAEPYPCQESFLEEVFSRPPEGVEVEFLMRARDGDSEPVRTWNDARVKTMPERPSHPVVRALKSYATDLRYVPRMLRCLREFSPDVVIARDMTFPFFLAIVFRPFFRYVAVFQKTFPNELRWFDPSWVHAHRLPWLWTFCRHVENAALHRLMRDADAVVPITSWMADELHDSWRIRRALMFPYGMGVDREDVRQLAGEQSAPPTKLVYTGTMGQTRRLEVLIDAFAALRARRPEHDARLTLVGGEPAEVDRLLEHARSRGVASFVEITGRVPRGAVYEILRDHHVGVPYIPRDVRFRVASPTKLIECLAMGMPCVSTDACALSVVLAEQTGGVIVTDDSASGFADGLVRLLDEREQWTSRARESRETVLGEYDYAAMQDRLMALLRRLHDHANDRSDTPWNSAVTDRPQS